MAMIKDSEVLIYDGMHKTVEDLIADLQGFAEKIGKQTEVILTYSRYDGDDEGCFTLDYERLATPAEEAFLEKLRLREQEKERELYLKLKAKYEA